MSAAPSDKPRIVLAGGTGFLGKLLQRHFADAGCDVVVLTRQPANPNEIQWDGRTLGSWAEQLEGAVALINLSGKSVNCRYNERNRRLIMDSRVESTRILNEAVSRCQRPPRTWLNASTATIYKHSLDRDMDENSTDFGATPEAKDAFSVSVTQNWEKAFFATQMPNTCKVALRISMVLGTEEKTVFRIFRKLTLLGLGGRMGQGNQYVSWIHEHDFSRAVQWLLDHERIDGPVNMTAPGPLPNREMMGILRRACGMPIGLPATRWMLEIGAFLMRTETELLLKSRRVVPRRLLESGFEFKFPKFDQAVEELNARLKN